MGGDRQQQRPGAPHDETGDEPVRADRDDDRDRVAGEVGTDVDEAKEDRLKHEGATRYQGTLSRAHQRAAERDLLHEPVGQRQRDRRRDGREDAGLEPGLPEEGHGQDRTEPECERRQDDGDGYGGDDDRSRRPAQRQGRAVGSEPTRDHGTEPSTAVA